ncbi:integrase core domain-containing protein [Streptomyces anulatus]|uniref:integrase core domain-containing protein n=1 Tax=Streptomyces anulatus TaxID=1892 RepID=UPI003558EA30
MHYVLTRHGPNRLAYLDRPTDQVIRRYERERPGELDHVDVKKPGRIPDGGGHRTLGRHLRGLPHPRSRFLPRTRRPVHRTRSHGHRLGLPRGPGLEAAPTELGATGKVTRPHRPQTNGQTERFNRTLADKWAYQQHCTSNDERTEALAAFLHTHNHHRSHTH